MTPSTSLRSSLSSLLLPPHLAESARNYNNESTGEVKKNNLCVGVRKCPHGTPAWRMIITGPTSIIPHGISFIKKRQYLSLNRALDIPLSVFVNRGWIVGSKEIVHLAAVQGRRGCWRSWSPTQFKWLN